MILPLIVSLLFALSAQSTGYRAEIESFRQHRAEEIGGPTGWAALVGLHWLTPGSEMVVGSDSISGVHLTGPSAPGSSTSAADACLPCRGLCSAFVLDRP